MYIFSRHLLVSRYAGNPILDLVAASWWESQLFDPRVMVNPLNSSQLLMYLSGMATPVQSGVISIGLFTAPIADPYTWTEVSQVLTPAGGDFDSTHVRLDDVIWNADDSKFYMYYTGITGTDAIGLATSTDGITFTRHASNPILTATGNGRNDGTHVSQSAVIKEGSNWTMIYSYRDVGSILPGYRYATSSDGIAWTKGGAGDILTTNPLYAEWHQILKVNGVYHLLYESGNNTTPFNIFMATAPAVTGPYTKLTEPVLRQSGEVGAFDRYHVATASLYQHTDGSWKLFYQGAQDHDQPYGTNSWPLGVVDFVERAHTGGSRA